jgi:hypothetical protein
MTKIRVQLPTLARADTFSDPSRTIMSAEGAALLTYDPGTRSGFIYRFEGEVWLIHAPVDFLQFVVLARLHGYTINDGEDARRWLDACSPNAHGENVVAFPQGKRH